MAIKNYEHDIWDMVLDGIDQSIIAAEIAYSRGGYLEKVTRDDVYRLIDAGFPEEYENDPRHIYSVRAFWIYLEDRINPATGVKDAFIVVFTRGDMNKLPDDIKEKILIDFQSTSDTGSLDLSIIEYLPISHATKYVHENCYLAWIVDENNNVTRYDGRYSPDEIAKKLAERANGK